LYLCNHQVDIESVLFNFLAQVEFETPIQTISRVEHVGSWVGQLDRFAADHPGMKQPERILYFDRADPAGLFKVLDQYRRARKEDNCSLMVHVEGELGLTCRQPVTRASSVFLDLAVELDLPIIPVRFVGGLPASPLPQTIPFPINLGQQDYVCGTPIFPADLANKTLSEKLAEFLGRINGMAPLASREEPLPGDPTFAAAVEQRIAAGDSAWSAIMIETIAQAPPELPGLDPVRDALFGGRTITDPWLATFVAYFRQGSH
jgi:hypothetical protein